MEPKFYFGHFDVGFQGVLFSHFHQKRSKEYDHHSSWPRVESYPTVLSFDYTFPPNIEGHPSFEFPLLSHIAMFLENFKLYQSLHLLTFNSRNFSPGSAQARETAGAEASTPQWPWKVHSLRILPSGATFRMAVWNHQTQSGAHSWASHDHHIHHDHHSAGFRSRLAKGVIPLLEMLELFWRLVDETPNRLVLEMFGQFFRVDRKGHQPLWMAHQILGIRRSRAKLRWLVPLVSL